ncbi:hypothetical protein BGZ49_000122 [Haplosporangium sp. Z 27]|nr:hypothetical protein BGZ49_000122 [Haplosporangium sp. Z 27]
MSSSDHPSSDSLPNVSNDTDSNDNTTPLSSSSTALTSPRITTVTAAAPADSAISSPTTSLRTTIGADSDQPATSPPTTSSMDTDIPVVNAQQDLLSSIRENAGNPPSTVAISTATATWPSSSSPNRFHTSLSLTSPSRQFPQFPLRSSQLANRQLHLPLPEREDSSRPRAITFGTLKKASMSHRIPSFSTEKKSKMTTLPSYLQCTTFKQYFQPEGGIEHVSGLTPIEREPSKRRRLLVESSRRRHMHRHDSDTSSGDGSSTSGSSSGSDSSYENDSSVGIKMERPGINDTDASSIRANRHIPPQCGVYYFEVLIKSKGKQGYIGIGVCNATVDLNRLPGWEPQSWGYHGDDGNSFEGCGNGRPFGPVFTTGDVIGCGVNFRDMTLFFTKNGVHLGVAFRNLKGTLYPTVGMRTVGEVVEANFGQREFVFNIENYVRNEKVEAWQTLESSIQTAVVEKKQLGNISQSLSDLVLSYMVHHGYTEIIRKTILDGEIDKAMKLLDEQYPGVTTDYGDMLLQLRCQKFVEMVSQASTSLRKLDEGFHIYKDAPDMTIKESPSVEHMDVDQDSPGPPTDQEDLEGFGMLKDAIKYGRFLQEEYKNNRRRSVQDMLVDAFSVLAYTDVKKSGAELPHRPKLITREKLANTVNKVILASQNLPTTAPLETMYRHTTAMMSELTNLGVGAAAFYDVDKDCLE